MFASLHLQHMSFEIANFELSIESKRNILTDLTKITLCYEMENSFQIIDEISFNFTHIQFQNVKLKWIREKKKKKRITFLSSNRKRWG